MGQLASREEACDVPTESRLLQRNIAKFLKSRESTDDKTGVNTVDDGESDRRRSKVRSSEDNKAKCEGLLSEPIASSDSDFSGGEVMTSVYENDVNSCSPVHVY